jgi:hypothetical protein
VREQWASLLAEGFAIADESAHGLELKSEYVDVVVADDPRGEVEVRVFRPGTEQGYGWSYTGMVGRTSASRLLEIALAEMRADPAILRGDPHFYDTLAEEKRASAQAWTKFYSGHGPRPVTRDLP